MIIADTLESFPECPTFGMVGEPRYDVRIISREGGFERRNRRWRYPLHFYTSVPMGQRDDEVIQAVLEFWHAVGGREITFRYRDYADFKSCRTTDTVAATDAPLDASDDSPTSWQLLKRYTRGSLSQDRPIRRPDGSTIRIANHLGVEQASSRWTIDEGTGLLTIEPSFVGTPTTWGGEFDVPCRFDSELGIELSNRLISNVTVSLKEDREGGAEE